MQVFSEFIKSNSFLGIFLVNVEKCIRCSDGGKSPVSVVGIGQDDMYRQFCIFKARKWMVKKIAFFLGSSILKNIVGQGK